MKRKATSCVARNGHQRPTIMNSGLYERTATVAAAVSPPHQLQIMFDTSLKQNKLNASDGYIKYRLDVASTTLLPEEPS
jgi:hypothetical protein